MLYEKIWKYNGFSFNTSCNCNACQLSFESRGYGDVRCIAVSSDHIFASSDSNIIQFWKFTETQQNTNIESDTKMEELKRNSSASSIHSVGVNTLDKRINAIGNVEYMGNLVCGHRGMITSLKVFGDVLISGSKDGFITIWSATQLVNISILHYGPNPVLDFTIFPNPYPLCHITIWNEHLNALKKLHQTDQNLKQQQNKGLSTNLCTPSPTKRQQMNQPPKVISNEDSNPRWPSLPNEVNQNDENESKSPMPVMQYVSLHSLYENDENNKIQDTIMGFCGTTNPITEQRQQREDNILANEDAPDVLASVFRAAIPSTPGSSNNSNPPDDMEPIIESPILTPTMPSKHPKNNNKQESIPITSKPNAAINERRVLSREIMHNASNHFGSISLILKDLKLIVGGTSGEIHIWHIGNNRSAFNMTTNWERETILRGHGDRVTCLESFGTHLMSAYSNGSIKVSLLLFI